MATPKRDMVVAMLNSGMCLKEIAYKLSISYYTAKAHRRLANLHRTRCVQSLLKTCAYCDTLFTAKNKRTKNCSKSCGAKGRYLCASN